MSTGSYDLITMALCHNFLRVVSTANITLDDLASDESQECSRGSACLTKIPIGKVIGFSRGFSDWGDSKDVDVNLGRAGKDADQDNTE